MKILRIMLLLLLLGKLNVHAQEYFYKYRYEKVPLYVVSKKTGTEVLFLENNEISIDLSKDLGKIRVVEEYSNGLTPTVTEYGFWKQEITMLNGSENILMVFTDLTIQSPFNRLVIALEIRDSKIAGLIKASEVDDKSRYYPFSQLYTIPKRNE